MRINVKKSENPLPVRATSKSAAYDVVAISDPKIVGEEYPEGGWKRIDYIEYDTGLITAPQDDNYGRGYHILVHPRSSVSKYNLILANSIGLIDNDYRKSLLARYKYVWQPEDFVWGGQVISKQGDTEYVRKIIIGHVNMEKIYKKGDRVAQLVVEPTTDAEWVYVEDVDVTERTGGFGSTDTPTTSGLIPIVNKEVKTALKNQIVEKSYESKVDLIEKWKNVGSPNHPIPYEQLIREREKQLNQ